MFSASTSAMIFKGMKRPCYCVVSLYSKYSKANTENATEDCRKLFLRKKHPNVVCWPALYFTLLFHTHSLFSIFFYNTLPIYICIYKLDFSPKWRNFFNLFRWIFLIIFHWLYNSQWHIQYTYVLRRRIS